MPDLKSIEEIVATQYLYQAEDLIDDGLFDEAWEVLSEVDRLLEDVQSKECPRSLDELMIVSAAAEMFEAQQSDNSDYVDVDTTGEVMVDRPDIAPACVLRSLALNRMAEVTLDDALRVVGGCSPRMTQVHSSLSTTLFASAWNLFQRAVEAWPDNAAALVSMAQMARDFSAFDVALRLFERVSALPVPVRPPCLESGNGDDDDDEEEECSCWVHTFVLSSRQSCVPVAVYMSALLASTMGCHDAALLSMRRLAMQYRIDPCVWSFAHGRHLPSSVHPPTEESSVKQLIPDSATIKPVLYPGAVPPALCAVLTKALAPGSRYWAQNEYDSSEYFSWWYSLSSPPTNAVEILIKDHLHALTGRDDLVGAEWWTHTRQSNGRDLGHQLHFDMEEQTLEADGRILHPDVSSVCYLTGAESGGGATIVIDQTIDDTEPAAGGWLVRPVDGAFMTFQGDLLHGALPSAPNLTSGESRRSKRRRISTKSAGSVSNNSSDWASSISLDAMRGHSSSKAPGAHRLVILIAWWARDDFSKNKNKSHGVQAPIPRVTRTVSWPEDMFLSAEARREDREWASIHARRSAPRSIIEVKPVWQKIPPCPVCAEIGGVGAAAVDDAGAKPSNNCGCALPVEVPTHCDQRFFAKEMSDYKDRVLAEHCR
eukprot:TRINITY_DN7592_c0_g1_i1.p1 TRINITY_DN7592_c0_g1~~TRINITY_DN7592_c0_g1_i1.p1  ORF type:complete len:654 (+),score=81.10 TRINITY_DN7592_c0_g1_i1:163-2124(+)